MIKNYKVDFTKEYTFFIEGTTRPYLLRKTLTNNSIYVNDGKVAVSYFASESNFIKTDTVDFKKYKPIKKQNIMAASHEQHTFKSNEIKKVLIALDYDSNSYHIAKIGHQLAEKIGAKTTLLHIIADEANYTAMQYNPIMGMGGFDYNAFADVVDTKGFLDAGNFYLEHIKDNLKDETIKILVKVGDASDEILVNANAINADLIVIGTHSKRWLEKVLVGSVSENVLKNSKIPLLIIPTKKHN